MEGYHLRSLPLLDQIGGWTNDLRAGALGSVLKALAIHSFGGAGLIVNADFITVHVPKTRGIAVASTRSSTATPLPWVST